MTKVRREQRFTQTQQHSDLNNRSSVKQNHTEEYQEQSTVQKTRIPEAGVEAHAYTLASPQPPEVAVVQVAVVLADGVPGGRRINDKTNVLACSNLKFKNSVRGAAGGAAADRFLLPW